MFWEQIFKIKRYQDKDKVEFYRDLMYLTIFLFIGYFIYDIVHLSQDMTNKELKDQLEFVNNQNTNFNTIYSSYKEIVIDFNLTTAGYIRGMILDVLNIIFLVMFALMIYVQEMIKKYGFGQH